MVAPGRLNQAFTGGSTVPHTPTTKPPPDATPAPAAVPAASRPLPTYAEIPHYHARGLALGLHRKPYHAT
jgi:hypothetical protein